jgi:hypothetical protein
VPVSRPWVLDRNLRPLFVLTLLLVLFVGTGISGLDFGRHWDEPFQQELIARPFQTGVFLPGSYNYGSVVFDIGSVLLAPETVSFLRKSAKEAQPYYDEPFEKMVPPEKSAKMVEFVYSKPFLLRLRTVFVFLTALTGAWTYLAVRACRRSRWEAVCAAAVILTSWEIAYHARWVAADTIQMQLVGLWLMLFALALHSSSAALKWGRAAAAVAGLACGTKYQGGILLIPLLIFTILVVRRENPAGQVWLVAKELAYQVGIFTAVFLISTPGAILQPLSFVQSLREVGHVYVTGHGGYTVRPFRQHEYLLFVYLAAVMGSRWPLLAVLISLTAVIGAVIMARRQPIVAGLIGFVPIAYFGYIICYHVMIVRNCLLIAPFLALFFARGAYSLWNAVDQRSWLRLSVIALFVGIFATNGAFLVQAAQTIHSRNATRFTADLVAHLRTHRGASHFLSPKVSALFSPGESSPANVTKDPSAAERCVLFADEVGPDDWENWSCNRLGQYQLISGPIEVNLDYYSSWRGASMVVEVSMTRAREMHLLPGL